MITPTIPQTGGGDPKLSLHDLSTVSQPHSSTRLSLKIEANEPRNRTRGHTEDTTATDQAKKLTPLQAGRSSFYLKDSTPQSSCVFFGVPVSKSVGMPRQQYRPDKGRQKPLPTMLMRRLPQLLGLIVQADFLASSTLVDDVWGSMGKLIRRNTCRACGLESIGRHIPCGLDSAMLFCCTHPFARTALRACNSFFLDMQ